jgi:hypothetical protein
MPEIRNETAHTKLRITREEAQHVADMLRYAVSLNTTAGLVSPTQRRLATTTYKAVELAALVLEGKTFDEAVEESSKAWTGSLEEDHRRALELMQKQRDSLRQAMSGRLPPSKAPNTSNTSKSPRTSSWSSSARTPRNGAAPKNHDVNALTREPESMFAATAGRGRILLCAKCT